MTETTKNITKAIRQSGSMPAVAAARAVLRAIRPTRRRRSGQR